MTIEICENCCGYGKVNHDVGSHKSDYEESVCKECLGSGRVEVEVRPAITPFKPGGSKRKH